MLNVKSLSKIAIICISIVLIGVPSAFCTDDVQTTVKTDNNGDISVNTSSGPTSIPNTDNSMDSGGSGSRDSSNNDEANTSSSGNDETPEITDTEEYSGVYKDRQMLPDMMMIHCKVNAEDIAKELPLLEKCIRQYVTEVNNANAATKAQALKDFSNLRYRALIDLMSTALTKASSIAAYEEKMNEYAKSTGESKTKFDTEVALAFTQAFSTDVLNSIRELYVEILKYEAINGFTDIDPTAILTEAEQSIKAKQTMQTTDKKDSTVVEVEAKITNTDENDNEEAPTENTEEEEEEGIKDESTEETTSNETAENSNATVEPASDAVVNPDSDAAVKARLAESEMGQTTFPMFESRISRGRYDEETLAYDTQKAREVLSYLQSLPPEQQTQYVKLQISQKQKIVEAGENALRKMREQKNQAE